MNKIKLYKLTEEKKKYPKIITFQTELGVQAEKRQLWATQRQKSPNEKPKKNIKMEMKWTKKNFYSQSHPKYTINA